MLFELITKLHRVEFPFLLKLISSSLNMGLSSLFSPVYKTDSKMEKKKKAQLKTKSRSVKKSSHKSSHSERKSIKSSRKKRTKVSFKVFGLDGVFCYCFFDFPILADFLSIKWLEFPISFRKHL